MLGLSNGFTIFRANHGNPVPKKNSEAFRFPIDGAQCTRTLRNFYKDAGRTDFRLRQRVGRQLSRRPQEETLLFLWDSRPGIIKQRWSVQKLVHLRNEKMRKPGSKDPGAVASPNVPSMLLLESSFRRVRSYRPLTPSPPPLNSRLMRLEYCNPLHFFTFYKRYDGGVGQNLS